MGLAQVDHSYDDVSSSTWHHPVVQRIWASVNPRSAMFIHKFALMRLVVELGLRETVIAAQAVVEAQVRVAVAFFLWSRSNTNQLSSLRNDIAQPMVGHDTQWLLEATTFCLPVCSSRGVDQRTSSASILAGSRSCC